MFTVKSIIHGLNRYHKSYLPGGIYNRTQKVQNNYKEFVKSEGGIQNVMTKLKENILKSNNVEGFVFRPNDFPYDLRSCYGKNLTEVPTQSYDIGTNRISHHVAWVISHSYDNATENLDALLINVGLRGRYVFFRTINQSIPIIDHFQLFIVEDNDISDPRKSILYNKIKRIKQIY
ncbi:Hypothetical protein HVR_LOCUS258 [uncultured virus]|nr:Hypothetical protein HVR_LOCUS258 [uncultured virus]